MGETASRHSVSSTGDGCADRRGDDSHFAVELAEFAVSWSEAQIRVKAAVALASLLEIPILFASTPGARK